MTKADNVVQWIEHNQNDKFMNTLHNYLAFLGFWNCIPSAISSYNGQAGGWAGKESSGKFGSS